MAPAKAKVELEAFPRSQAIPATETHDKFPVLVRFTAAARQHAEATGMDVVAVLDIRSSMPGERLERIKQAMMVIIDKLSPEDRLSIVSFGTNVHRLTELMYMSDHGRDAAKLKVNQLQGAEGEESAGSPLPLPPPLREGAMILRDRQAEGSGRRVGCMLFLSAGNCREVVVPGQEQARECDFPVHTLGLGAHHDPKHMKHIADQTSGTYYSLMDNQLVEAMSNFMASLTSPVAARSVKITVRAHEGVTISSMESGGYGHRVSPDKLSGEINILDNMYAGERKNFIVYLTVAADAKEKLVTVDGWYQGCRQLAGTDVSVVRKECSSTAINSEVAAELVRLRLEKGVSAMVEEAQGEEEEEEDPAGSDRLEKLWEEIKGSVDGRGASKAAMSGLGKEVAEMKKSGVPYMLSWLSCHKWQRQRATKTRAVSTAWQDLMAWSIPSSRLLIPFLVLVLALLLTMTLSWPPTAPNRLHGTSIEKEQKRMDKQLLLAFVHASTVLRTSTDANDAQRVAEAYVQLMLNRIKGMELWRYAGAEQAMEQMNRFLYLAMVQACADQLEVIQIPQVEPEEQTREKSALIELRMPPSKQNPIKFWP